MSSDTDDDGQPTRPISVAELLARNGTIGAPPVGGRRRRRRGNSAAVSVAELTGEIPVIRDEPVDAVIESESEPEPEAEATEAVEEATEAPDEATEAVEEAPAEAVEEASEQVAEEVVAEVEDEPEPEPVRSAPPLSSDPHPRRGGKPERSHDPRPLRRSSGAEQMSYDPVDESVDLAELVGDQAADEETLRSYLKASGGTLFSGETVADDLARRGISDEDADDSGDATAAGDVAAPGRSRPAGSRLGALRHGVVAVLQSVLAVGFGAGLFLGFDQLWRWNTIVALVLSVLVILGLVIAVRVVRKTEDIASTLIAVAVGAMVTLGPLALLQSYG